MIKKNRFIYANNPSLWFDIDKPKAMQVIEWNNKRKLFALKHLSTNLKFFTLSNAPGKEIRAAELTNWTINSFGNTNLYINYISGEPGDEDWVKKELVIKYNPLNGKIINTIETKTWLRGLLYQAGVNIGLAKMQIMETEVIIAILRNDKKILKINEDIINDLPAATEYQKALSLINNNYSRYEILFNDKIKKYLFSIYHFTSDNKFFGFIAEIINNKVDVPGIKSQYHKFKKRLL